MKELINRKKEINDDRKKGGRIIGRMKAENKGRTNKLITKSMNE